MMQVSQNIVLFLAWCASATGIVGIFLHTSQMRYRQKKRLSRMAAGGQSIPKRKSMLFARSANHPWKVSPDVRRQLGIRNRNINLALPYIWILFSLLGASLCVSVTLLFCDLECLVSWKGLAGVVLSAFLASLFPGKYFAYNVKRRRRQIEKGMPDLIDLLTLCVDAGLTLDAALARAVRQMRQINPVLSQEMQFTLDEINILPDRAQAFTNLQKRTGSDLINFFVLAVNQTDRYGTPLSATLKALAEENRRSVLIDLENRANRLPVLLSLPLILFILPPAIGLSVGPGFILMLRGLGG